MNELRKVMTDNNLTTSDVAKIVGRKKNTVEGWLVRETKRPIPAHMIKLLELHLKAK